MKPTLLVLCVVGILLITTGCVSQPQSNVEPMVTQEIPTTTITQTTTMITPTPTATEEPIVGITTLYAKGDYGFDNVSLDLDSWTYGGDWNYPFNPHTITLKFYDKNKFPIRKDTDVRTMNWQLWAGSPEDVKRMYGKVKHYNQIVLPGESPQGGNFGAPQTRDAPPEGAVYVSLDVVTNRVN